uniref:Saposin B-type domain-containing protein n=1 Tax=Zea mays TaxID=4577 RepID=A0A804QP88_MAIZE
MDTGAQAMFIISLVLWCTTSFALDDAAATRIPIVGTLPLSMKENPQLCQLCEEFASEALFYLNENETQTEIIDTLHQACSKFGSFKLECTRLVDYYVPLFFTKIASLSPEEFCASASFCGGVTFIRLPRHEDTCTLCHEVVDELKIIEILLKGCNNAEDYVQKCKRLIIQNAPIIMENIKKFLEKRDFCNSIHVCGSKSVRAGSQVLRSLSSA